MALADFLTHRCDLMLQASLVDATGGVVRDPRAAIRSNVPCLVRPGGGRSERVQDRAAQTATHRVYFDKSMGIDRRHAILWGERVLMVQSETDFNAMGELVAYDCEEVVT